MIKTSAIMLRALTGSRAHGTETEDSDYDWITAHILDKAYYLGIKSEVRPDALQEGDTTDHEVRHFIGMCCKFNPNTIVALWSPNVAVSREWTWLTEQRHLFNSKKAITTFLRFATGQIKQAGNPNTMGQLGAKRKALIDKYGYDPTFLYHAMRVAKMIREFAESNGDILRVNRRGIDDQYLLAVRNAMIPLDSCIENFNQLREEIREAEKTCTLPDEPNYAEINRLTVQSMEASL